MPVLNIDEDERSAVIAALHHERVRLTAEWSKAFDDNEGPEFIRDSELERLAKAIDLTTDLRRKIEVAADITKAAWHNEYGWLHSKKDGEIAKATVEAEADLIERDLHEFGEAVEVADIALDDIEKRIVLVTGQTTLPDELDGDDWMFDVTDPDEPKVKRIEIKIDGVTRTVYSTDRNIEQLERALVDLQTAQRAYLGGCVSEMVS